jgi:hypothetical protein
MLLPALVATFLLGLAVLIAAATPRIVQWNHDKRRKLRRLEDLRRLR